MGCTAMSFFQAFSCAGGTPATVQSYAEFAPQVAQGSGTILSGFANLPLSNCLADTDVHELPSWICLLRTILILRN
jgi:hypothetical protein